MKVTAGDAGGSSPGRYADHDGRRQTPAVEFESDPDKAEENLTKHGVGVVEASTIFSDPLEVTIPDPEHSDEEVRFLSLGLSADGRLPYTEREGIIRIIHARVAAPRERSAYEQESKD